MRGWVTVHSKATRRPFTVRQLEATLDDGTSISGQVKDFEVQWQGTGPSWGSFVNGSVALTLTHQNEQSVLLDSEALDKPKSIKVRPDIADINGDKIMVVQHNLDDILGDYVSTIMAKHGLEGTSQVIDYNPSARSWIALNVKHGIGIKVDHSYIELACIHHFNDAATKIGLNLPVELMSEEEASHRRSLLRQSTAGKDSTDYWHPKLLFSGGEEIALSKHQRTYDFNIDPDPSSLSAPALTLWS